MNTHRTHRIAAAFATLAMAVTLAAPTSAAFAQYGRPGYAPQYGWDTPPQEFRDIQRQGFHDGVEGARKDFDHHRYPNVNNRSEFRHPHVPPSAVADYRQGFQRGYDVATNHLLHGAPGPR